MALVLKDPSVVPDTGWMFPHVAPGQFICVRNYQILYSEVEKVYRSNNQPVPSEQDVIDWMCANLYLECREGPTPFINRFTQGLPIPAKGCCGK